ncbi:MAG: DUF1211 domain-containing protein [Armatimonadetes bacterium]|nr:DUF1211 domain-containing protein [Armatimonadota bacterium]
MTNAENEALNREEAAIEEKNNDRLLVLSDGVFAIVVTLLALAIKVPPVSVAPVTLWGAFMAFGAVLPSLLGFVLSFVTVGIMWANHCVLFSYIKKNDHALTVWNTILLLVVTLMPFVTDVLAQYLSLPAPYPQVGMVVYCGVSLLMALAFNLLWRHASHENRLLDPAVDPRLVERVHQRYRFGPLVYLVCFALTFWSVPFALGMVTLLALMFALPYGDEARAIEERLARLLPGRRR